ncbi:MAG: GNAT family N-acetyltransferase [Acidimicrobiales bacterium]
MTRSESARGPVRTAVARDLSAIREMLIRAFYDDPQFVWLMPSDRARAARLGRFFGTLLRFEGFGLADIEVVESGDTITGAAVWFPPGGWPPPASRQLRALPGYVHSFGRRVGAAGMLVNAAARVHPKTGYWYLACIGVEPATQGTGVGGALLRSRLACCDAQGASAFLESSKPSNVPLYSHFGFVAGPPLRLPPGSPEITPMTRPPTTLTRDHDPTGACT